jgi:NhaP-type Na+/H+ or K+/H+ antiporter
MVRQLALDRMPATVLVLESALTDVLCIVIAGALLKATLSGHANPFGIAWNVLASLAFAAVLGGLAGLGFLFAVNLVRAMPNAMVAVIAFAFITFGIAELLGVSGAIAVLSLGFTISNRVALGITRLRAFDHVADMREPRYVGWFLADAIFLLKTFFFVYLGISVRFADAPLAGWAALAMLVVYVARVVVVRLVVPRGPTSRWDAGVMAVMVPKGLAAAVLAGLPLQMGIAEGAAIQQFAYMSVFVSIVLTSVLVPQLVRGPVGVLFSRALRPFEDRPVSDAAFAPSDEEELPA